MEDQKVKLSMTSSEKSLISVVSLVKQYEGVLPTLEVIKLEKACISDYFYAVLTVAYVGSCMLF